MGRVATFLGWSGLARPAGATRALHDHMNLCFMPVFMVICTHDFLAAPLSLWQPLLFSAYFVVDTLWLAAYDPAAVVSPVEIVVHHILSLGLLAGSIAIPALRTMWAVGGLIEFNTLFLIGMRTAPPGWLQEASKLITVATWLPIRFGVPASLFWTLHTVCAVGAGAGAPASCHGAPVALLYAATAGLGTMQAYWTVRLAQKLCKGKDVKGV